ncbi:MAG TPA: preprotein translocase subunit SecG [Kofleriaceae bacterium]
MSTLITVLHVITCLFLMLTVLLQSGKGGGMGAAFGGGGNAATVFGGSGASGFLKRLTAIAGTVFMITSMVLAFIASRNSGDAFETFGEKQKEIAAQKKKAKAAADSALKAGSGSAGSGSGGSGAVGPGSAGAGSAMIPFGSGAGLGSATPVEAGSAAVETPPVETPIDPPATGSAAKPAAGSAAKPAAKPATGSGAKPAAAKPAKPAAEAPARAPTGESPPTTGSNAPAPVSQ